MMKQLISMLLALMMLLGMATAEDAAEDDAWKGEIAGYAIELARTMDEEIRNSQYVERRKNEDGEIPDELASVLAEIDHTMPQKVYIAESGQDRTWRRLKLILIVLCQESNLTVEEITLLDQYMMKYLTDQLTVADEKDSLNARKQVTPRGVFLHAATQKMRYGGGAPESGIMLLCYEGQGSVLVRWYAQNGCVCLSLLPSNFASENPTEGDVSLYYEVPFAEFDIKKATFPEKNAQTEEPDAAHLQMCALAATKELQVMYSIEQKMDTEAASKVETWDAADMQNVQVTYYPVEQLTDLPYQLQNQMAQKVEHGAVIFAPPESNGTMSSVLSPCGGAGGLLTLIPETGTPVVVAWQTENGTADFRACYIPLDVLEEMLMQEE